MPGGTSTGNTIISIRAYQDPLVLHNTLHAETIGIEANPGAINTENNEAHKNYTGLKKIYFKWNYSILQSKRYYKKLADRYLVKILGKWILTDNDYYLIVPGITEGNETSFSLYVDNWLQIKGRTGRESLSKVVDIDRNVQAKWLRTKKLISIKGRVSDHRLLSDKNEEVVILYLQDITLAESKNPDDAGKDSK